MLPEKSEFQFDPVRLLEQQAQAVEPRLQYRGGDAYVWQARLKTKLIKLLGIDQKSGERCELNVRSLWRREHPLGLIEKLVFTSEVGYDVPAYLCIPHDSKRPMPVFICLQGHDSGIHNSIAVDPEDDTRQVHVDDDLDLAIAGLKRGLATLCIEQRGFGECLDRRRSRYRPCHNPAMLAMMMGRTLLGDRIFDIDRAIDYLESRGDVDLTRLGVMGHSGGGSAALFAGGLLDRITHVMPSCCFSTYQASLMSINHCLCNYVPRLLEYADLADVAGLSAPKPLVIVSGLADPIYPIEPARESFARLKCIYRACNAGERCRHVVGVGGHCFYADQAWPVMLDLMDRSF
jgi:dienelactone hydrolase